MSVVRFENILETVGSSGRWQWRMLTLVTINGMFVTFFNLSSVFMAATPDYWCAVPEVDFRNLTQPLRFGWSEEKIMDFALPRTDDFHSKCSIYRKNYTNVFRTVWNENYEKNYEKSENIDIVPCESWSYGPSDLQWTFTTKWNLVCQYTILASILKSAFLFGILIGSLTGGFISDKFGRRFLSFLGTSLAIVAGTGTAFPTHYAAIVVFRTMVGIGCALTISAFYVLLAETTAPKRRGIYQMAYLSIFSIGMMILPGIAYYVRNWTYLALIISLSSTISLLFCRILPESPRWLILKGKLDEAYKVLASISKTNGKEIEKNALMEMIYECHRNEIVSTDIIEKRPTLQLFRDLFRQEMRKATIISYILWGLTASTYYVIIFNTPSLGSNLFLTFFLSGATELPSYVLGGILLPCVGRRTLLSGTCLIGGILSILYFCFSKIESFPWWICPSLAFSSKFSISIGFCALYIYTTELFPTRHRHIALGTSSTCGRIGAIVAPVIVDLLGNYSGGATVMGVYGAQSLLAGFLCLLLPETKTKMLPDTLEDVKHFEKLKWKL